MAHVKETNSGLWAPESTHEKVDSQKMFIDNIKQHEANYTDLIGRIHKQIDSITELKALDVASEKTTIKAGTVVMVTGMGLYYYNPKSVEEADDEEIVKPTTGKGNWILSGGGGNLIVNEEDYGEDTDRESGLMIKIKKLFNKKKKTNFYPLTTLKAVIDAESGDSLDKMLITGDDEESTKSVNRDVDTIGGKYTAEDIDRAITYDPDEEEEVEDVEIVDADRLGGRITAEDIDKIKEDLSELEWTPTGGDKTTISTIKSRAFKIGKGTFITWFGSAISEDSYIRITIPENCKSIDTTVALTCLRLSDMLNVACYCNSIDGNINITGDGIQPNTTYQFILSGII